MTTAIRDAVPADAPALAVLERLSPEMGRATVQLDPRVDHFTLAARYPCARGYVAVSPTFREPVGMVFASTAPTQVNGLLVKGTYLFSLRVHPRYRRDGVASALLERALEDAQPTVAWAAVAEGNLASLRTFTRASFERQRDLEVRIVAPLVDPFPSTLDLVCRPAAPEDLPLYVAALNARYARHHLWRPLTEDHLSSELCQLGHYPHDLTLCFSRDGSLLGGVVAFPLARVVRARLLGFRSIPQPLNRFLAPLFGLAPVRPIVLRHALLPVRRRRVTHALLGAVQRRFWREGLGLAIALDPGDAALPGISALPGFAARVHVMVRADQPVGAASPWHLG